MVTIVVLELLERALTVGKGRSSVLNLISVFVLKPCRMVRVPFGCAVTRTLSLVYTF